MPKCENANEGFSFFKRLVNTANIPWNQLLSPKRISPHRRATSSRKSSSHVERQVRAMEWSLQIWRLTQQS